MAIFSPTLTAALAVLLQVPAPAPTAAEPAPPAAMAPAPAMEPAAPASPVAAPEPAAPAADSTNPKHWRVAPVAVQGANGAPPRQETRVLRGDDVAVTVGEGLTDIKQAKRLDARATAGDPSETSIQAILGRVVVLGAGVVLALGGVVLAGFGGALLLAGNASMPEPLAALAISSPSILVTGLIVMVIGLITAVVTGALWAWSFFRGPPPPDPAAVAFLASQLNWDPKEAQEVVAAHNAAVDAADAKAIPPPPPAPAGAAPAPDAAPAPSAPAPVAAPSTGAPVP